MTANKRLDHAQLFPYDAGEQWWDDEGENSPPPLPRDRYHAAARGVLAELNDRRGISQELEQVDHETRDELTRSLAEIIKLAVASPSEERASDASGEGKPDDS